MHTLSFLTRSPARFLGAVMSVAGALAPLGSASAQPGSTYAMTQYQKCSAAMMQIPDVNGDGKLDFVCLNGEPNSLGGIHLISGARNPSNQLPILASNLIPGLGGEVIEVHVGAARYLAACHSSSSTVVRIFRADTLASVATRDVGYVCSDMKAIDINNDGTHEILVSSAAARKVDALAITAPTSTTLALTPLFAYTRLDLIDFGAALVALDDVNGDGLNDWAVGAPGANGGSGAVGVMVGNLSGTIPLQFIDGASSGGRLGSDLAHLDLSGDGVMELLVAATGESAVHQLNRTGSSFGVTRSMTRAGGDGFGIELSNQAVDVNGDNKPDLAVRYTGGTALLSGRSFQVIKDFPGFNFPPSVIVEQSHHDPDRVYGGLILGKWTSLAGSNNNGDYFYVQLADNWGCPTMNVALAHSPSEYAGVYGNDGTVPTITVPKGCAMPGGDIAIESDMSPNAPAVILAAPFMASPFPAIAGTANRLVPKRDSLEALEPAFAPANGLARVVVRNITPTLTDPDGAGPLPAEVRWFIQAIQFAQFAPTAQASGKGIASSMGHQLRAVQP